MSCGIATGPNVAIYYKAETAPGTQATGNFKTLRVTKRDINFEKSILQSAEIRADRQYSDVRHGMRKVAGTLAGEISYGAYDDLINAAIVNPAPGAEIPTFTVERAFTDIEEFQVFLGCAVNTMKISCKPEAMATIEFGMLGMDALPLDGTSAAGTPTAATTNAPMSGFDGVMKEGGVTIGVVSGIDIDVDNQRSLVGVVGANTSPCVFEGRLKVTGTATVMFLGATMFNKFINETTSSIELSLIDTVSTVGVTNTIKITLPRVKYTGGSITPPAEGPIMITMPFQALVDVTPASPTLGKSIVIASSTVGP